jgi:hypothetical protein
MARDVEVPVQQKQLDFQPESHEETEQEGDKGNTDAPMPNQIKRDIPRYVPPYRFISYPERLANTKLDNISFIIVVTQMPIYAKFLKDILSNMRKLDEETVTLIEKVSAIVMNRLHPKL